MKQTIIVGATFALATGVAGFATGKNLGERDHERRVDRAYQQPALLAPAVVTAQRLVNPLLDCEIVNPSRLGSHVALEREIQDRIRDATTEGDATHVSVYFRALNDGPWIGIAQNHEYAPASMMKVPLMVAVLRWANDDPSRLDRKVRYDKPFGATVRTTFESVQIELGRSYTVRELMEKMIWNSDNEAAFLLMDVVTPQFAYSVMREVGIASPDQSMSGDFVSVREYASVFRLLYNATYLDREASLTALRTLTQTTFDKGLRAQIPREVMVAHKFGERILPDSPVRQLHDCGIVYHRTAPYVLCVMTRGHDMNKLADIIADISGLTYHAVSRAESVQ